ncbi:MATE family efflux transporter [Robiginitomaculum antarcticum]|uniref:MATE family efflux transporter n=1 Tax=Robiginitomaculum antarcticum TaxID=437507 RepID=UPI00035F617B|nr:MATE family efflux transporter [Robiginitomaculum antarcticum]
MVSARLTPRAVFMQSWPIMLANAAGPVVGFVDTLIIGRYAGTAALAGIGLGAVIYGIVYWGFGFLRMSTAGLAAQSDGQGDERAVQAHAIRAVPIGLLIGTLVLIFHVPLLAGAFKIYTAQSGIEQSAGTYISARLWGLPATLGTIALMGWFVGISRSQRALQLSIVLNIVNIILSPIFVVGLGWGLWGVGLGSAIAEWCGLFAGLYFAAREIKSRGGFRAGALTKSVLLNPYDLRRLGVSNGNIFIRTLALTFGFNFFGNAAASEGEVFLAGNHILLQFITLSALVLDGFAHTAEAAVGKAFGSGRREAFDRAVKLTSYFSAGFAVLGGAIVIIGGPFLIAALSRDPAVINSAMTFLPYCALAPIVGFAAYQLDGIFIGATATKQMRNAGIAAVIIYVGLHYLLQYGLGQTLSGHAIWLAFLGYYIARAVTLMAYYPGVKTAMSSPQLRSRS